MLTIKKAAAALSRAAAVAMLALALAPGAADARDGRAAQRAAADAGKGKAASLASYVRPSGDRARRADRRHLRQADGWRPRRYSRGHGHRRWAPPRRHRAFRYHGRPHRPVYRPRHRHRRHHHGDDALFGALIGFAVGAIVTDSIHNHPRHPAPYPTTVVRRRPAHGVLIRYEIGRSMHPADHTHAAVVLEKTRTGSAVEWTNPDTGNRYSLTPTRTFRNAAGEDCRDYAVWGWIGGFEEKLTGTACRTNDGAWRTVS
ncbi:MAG: RT0821/Lpp0805 family surface protein [Alphaproteobacteria bacterium]|nr:RT0821/Lpp0805 family surface protein [Alphaproteobacteria bacterium]